MQELKKFRMDNDLTQTDLGKYLGLGKSFVSKIENGKEKLPEDKFRKLINNDNGWNVSALTDNHNVQVGNNSSGVVVNGNNFHSPIDNRHYYSDSPDVLRAQIDLLDERIKEKDAQIKEKDAQIKQLLDIVQGFHK